MSQPQTILHVITSLNLGGAETMLCQLLEHTDRSRFHPVVVSLRPESDLSERVRLAGIPLHHLDMQSYFQFGKALQRLKALMRELRPALVQTWMYHADLLGTLAARGGIRQVSDPAALAPPVVWNVQHSSFDPRGTKLLSRMVRRLLVFLANRWPDKIVVCSKSSIELHARLGYPRDKMLHIVNGADTRRFLPDGEARSELRKKLGIPAHVNVIGMAGRNDPQKDYPTFFAAVRELQKTDKETCFIACGAGVTEADPAMALLKRQCPSPHNVFLLGPRHDMPRIYPAFDLATLSSAFGEGLPLTLCEALACGVPAVVTDVGDSGDVVGDCGLTVPPCEPRALAAAWQEMLAHPAEIKQRLREKARRRAEEKFSLPMIAEKYESLYSQLIEAKTEGCSAVSAGSIPRPAIAA